MCYSHGHNWGSIMIPAHAVACWIEGYDLVVEISTIVEDGRPYRIRYPLKPRGLELMLAMLKERARELKPIGTKAAPTKRSIESDLIRKFLETRKPRRAKPTFSPEQRENVRQILQRMGML